MSEHDDLLVALRDVGMTSPRAGDAGDARIRGDLQREITGRRRRPRRRLRIPSAPVPRITAIAAGATALAATAAGLVVATGALGGSRTSQIAFPGRHALAAGTPRTQDTADIIRRVDERIARGGTVVETAVYRHGQVRADGTLAHLGWEQLRDFTYAAANGTVVSNTTGYYRDGRVEIEVGDVDTRRPGGSRSDLETSVNPNAREYGRRRYADPGSGTGTTPGLFSRPAEVRRALSDGTAADRGTVEIDGTPAVVLSMTEPNAPGSPSTRIALYVDARTYQPLRSVSDVGGGSDLTVGVWRPATPGNIARARLSVPAGYTRTTPLTVNLSTYRTR